MKLISKAEIDQLEQEIMALVPSGKPYKAFKEVFKDFREATGIEPYVKFK